MFLDELDSGESLVLAESIMRTTTMLTAWTSIASLICWS
jgi:hypothetical protein